MNIYNINNYFPYIDMYIIVHIDFNHFRNFIICYIINYDFMKEILGKKLFVFLQNRVIKNNIILINNRLYR